MIDLLLIFANKFEKNYLQVSSLANQPCKESFLGTDFRQIDQNSQNSGKSAL